MYIQTTTTTKRKTPTFGGVVCEFRQIWRKFTDIYRENNKQTEMGERRTNGGRTDIWTYNLLPDMLELCRKGNKNKHLLLLLFNYNNKLHAATQTHSHTQ